MPARFCWPARRRSNREPSPICDYRSRVCFFSSRRRHTRCLSDWSSDVCSSDLYRLSSERVGDLWAAVRDVAVRHVAEVNQLADEYLGEREGVEHVSAEELRERLARGDEIGRASCRERVCGEVVAGKFVERVKVA